MGEAELRREQQSRAPTVGALGDAGAVAEATRKTRKKMLEYRPSRFLLEPLPAAPALPPSMAVVKPGRPSWQRSEHMERGAKAQKIADGRSAGFACVASRACTPARSNKAVLLVPLLFVLFVPLVDK